MGAILAIAVKDLRLLLRDKAGAFFTFGFPLVLAIFFGIVFGGVGGKGGGKMRLVAVNEDGGPASMAFLGDLKADEALAVRTGNTAEGQSVETPLTREEGLDAVRKGRAVACVIVPKGFEDSSVFSGEGIRIDAFVDPARNAEAGLLTGKLNEIAFRQMSRTFNDPKVMRKSLDKARASLGTGSGLSDSQKGVLGNLFNSLDDLSKSGVTMGGTAKEKGSPDAGAGEDKEPGGWSPVKVNVTELKPDDKPGPRNSFEISFPQGVVWGLMGCVVGFGASMAAERSRGTLLRLSVAPLRKHDVLLGKALGCFIACVMVQVMLVLMGLIPFIGIKVRDPGMMAVAVVVNAVGFTGVMMILSGFSRTEEAASGMGRAVIILLAMIGGGTIPLMFMPAFMETVSSFSPFKWAIMTIEGSLWRQYTLADMALPAGVLVGIGVVGFIVGALSLRRAEAV
jgi:ABC-2 type transport system permease protein